MRPLTVLNSHIVSVQSSSVMQPCPTLCDSTDCSSTGLPVHHQLSEFTKTHVHSVGDAIQPSHPLSSPASPAFNLSQHQGLFQWVSSLQKVAKVLEFQLRHQSFQWIFRTDANCFLYAYEFMQDGEGVIDTFGAFSLGISEHKLCEFYMKRRCLAGRQSFARHCGPPLSWAEAAAACLPQNYSCGWCWWEVSEQRIFEALP